MEESEENARGPFITVALLLGSGAFGLVFLFVFILVAATGNSGSGSAGSSAGCAVVAEFDRAGGAGVNRSVAQAAYDVAKQRGVSDRVLLALFETGLVESGFRNVANDGVRRGLEDLGSSDADLLAARESLSFPNDGVESDHSSAGYLQQQVWWGPMADLMDPAAATGLFLDVALEMEDEVGGTAGQLAQAVQVSAKPTAYDEREADALALIKDLSGRAPSAASVALVSDVGCDEEVDAVAAGVGADGPAILGPDVDDLPWPDSPIYQPSPLGMYNRECVDFVLWRMNKMAGVTGPPWKFHNSDLALGNAYEWMDAWNEQGWSSGREPRVGAVAWYDKFAGPSGAFGHVGLVSAVDPESGDIVIEEYNVLPHADHSYNQRVASPDEVSAFLYFPVEGE